ncbi:MAG: hypothetical protein SPL05_06465 [Eubacteriales bacterium]|nr:hypothetical protein [Eubacteriales bacterium]
MLKIIKTFVLAFLAYLLQVTTMPLFAFADITPNIILAIQAIIIVAYGRQHGLAASVIVAILMETMIQNLLYYNIIIYIAVALLGMIIFADKTERKLEMERATKKHYGNYNPLLRTVFCTMYMAILFEIATLAYGLLNGLEMHMNVVMRALLFIGYTTFLSIILMFPLRYFLNVPLTLPKFKKQSKKYLHDLDPMRGKLPIGTHLIKKTADPEELHFNNAKENVNGVAEKNSTTMPDMQFTRETNKNSIQTALDNTVRRRNTIPDTVTNTLFEEIGEQNTSSTRLNDVESENSPVETIDSVNSLHARFQRPAENDEAGTQNSL